jgi:signal peptidase
VVTFDARTIGDGRLTTHRVVGERPEGYITRGDGNTFTDQQSGEPVVAGDRIVAEAVQVNGQVLVIPNLADYVDAIRKVFASIGIRLGLSVNQVIAFILVGALAAYLLDETGAAGEKRTVRSAGRTTGLSGPLLVGGSVALVLAIATLTMTAGTGAIALPYDSVGPSEAGERGIPTGTTQNASVELRNGGLVPMTAVLSTDDPNATLSTNRVHLGPQSNATVNVSITAPSEPGSYEVTVERQQDLAVLPGFVLSSLSNAGHWLAVAVVNLLLAGVVGAFGAVLVGGGRVRLRPTRSVPAEVGLLRWLRSFYTRR